ncbi:S8 family serine peptidase [Micromonospora sp. WMMD975]|uniref:S8 family serine peptidase n=1 Tax=Micromonospora sp. WMMD975 TaxID=3016087 RepID=UPI00249A7C61|nr:S8 family serine peptidase [Micromonospora sp. WMMD975]WFE33710.1 S8 family serine peptidase [Micromonospora sp. WMMD975]
MVPFALAQIALATLPPSNSSTPLHLTIEKPAGLQWHLGFLNAAKAQTISRGTGVVIAVPDTGVAPHPDIRRNLLTGVDLTSPQPSDGQHDTDGHGTSMAGLIVADGGPHQLGVFGIAPEAKVLPIRGKIENRAGDTADLASGIEFAIANGADVLSISAAAAADGRLQQAIKLALQADIVVIAAAGNTTSSTTVEYPGREPGVIAVGGIDRNGNHAAISVTGPEIDVVAPAVDIYSTGLNGGYRVGTGTSDATAIVAGAAALIRSKYPDLPAEEVAHRLTATAIDKGPPGRDDQYGYGVIDLVAALTADVPPLGFESTGVTAPASTEARTGNGRDDGTVRGLVTLGVLLAAGGGYLIWRRRRRAGDPPPRISR